MSQQAQNDHYPSEEEAAMDYAAAVNGEIRDLFAAGADIVQIDEPYMQARPEKARAVRAWALNRALEGVSGTTAVHICFGYAAIVHQRPPAIPSCRSWPGARASRSRSRRRSPGWTARCSTKLEGKQIMLGVLDLERPGGRDARDDRRRANPARAAVRRGPRTIIVAPDCGMKYLPRDVAFAKMRAMVEAAAQLRTELASASCGTYTPGSILR